MSTQSESDPSNDIPTVPAALTSNLDSTTSYRTLKPLDREVGTKRLSNPVELCNARIHPFNVLMALAVYKKEGGKGSLAWDPVGARSSTPWTTCSTSHSRRLSPRGSAP